VEYQTVDQTASSPADYLGSIGVLHIPAGAASAKLAIPIVNDTINEPDETFAVVLSNPVGATITDGSATGTIVDDGDPVPSLTIADAAAPEGNSGTSNMNFTATLSAPSGFTINASFPVTSGTALAGYDIASSGANATFPPGTTTALVSVPIIGDTKPEHDETFTIKLQSANNLVLNGATATGTIPNDDPGVVIDDMGNTKDGTTTGVTGGPVVSADGNTVAFLYDFNSRSRQVSLLFVRDRTTGILNDVASSARGRPFSGVTLSGDGTVLAYDNGLGGVVVGARTLTNADQPSLDGDGNLLAYRAFGAGIRIYHYDTATTTLVTADTSASSPVISADGTHVAYEAADGSIQVFNVGTGTTAVASVATDSTPANGPSFAPSISADGRYVAFASGATNLVGGDTNGVTDGSRHDMTGGATIRVTVADNGSELPGGGSSPSISGDGSKVAFLVGGAAQTPLFVRTIAGSTLLVTTQATEAAISGDGHSVVFASGLALVDGAGFARHKPEAYLGEL
jgi:Calx-beta domain/WD40-like Beta Propeller Repeat